MFIHRINQKLDTINNGLDAINAKLDAINRVLQQIQTKEKQMAVSIDDVIAAVQAEKAVDDSAVALLNQLTALLQAAIATNDPTKVQAALDAINANKQALSDAVTANTPAAPTA